MNDCSVVDRSVLVGHIDTAEFPLEHRFDALQDFIATNLDVTNAPNPMRGLHPDASISVWRIGDVDAVASSADGVSAGRGASGKRVSRKGHIRVRLYENGHSLGNIGGREVAVGAGQILVSDVDLEVDWRHTQTDCVSLYIPYEGIGYDPTRHVRFLTIDATTSIGRLVGDSMRSLKHMLPEVMSSQATAIERGLNGLIASTLVRERSDYQLEHEANAASLRHRRKQAIKRYIEEHLADDDLDASRLTQVFFASRASIYRDFAEDGGIATYVRNRRLERAYSMLSERASYRGCIKQVAHTIGFHDQSSFNKLFRQRFGVCPSAVASPPQASH